MGTRHRSSRWAASFGAPRLGLGLLLCLVAVTAASAQGGDLWTMVEAKQVAQDSDSVRPWQAGMSNDQHWRYTKTGYGFSCRSWDQHGDGTFFVDTQWECSITWDAPPPQLWLGQEHVLKIAGHCSGHGNGAGWSGWYIMPPDMVVSAANTQNGMAVKDGRFYLTKDGDQGAAEYHIKVTAQTPDEFTIEPRVQGLPGGYGSISSFRYRRQPAGAQPAPPATPPAAAHPVLSARLERDTVVVVPGQVSQQVTVYIKGWRRNTADAVQVRFPLQQDLRGTHPNGIIVFPGTSAQDPANMGGFGSELGQTVAGNLGGYAQGEYPWQLLISANLGSPLATTAIPIVVSQPPDLPGVNLLLNVRTQPATPGQSGPNPNGGGMVNGATGAGAGAMTTGTSRTGLSARLDGPGSPLLRPGQVSTAFTLFIRGWRVNTTDPVEVAFVQQGNLAGDLPNDLRVVPGTTAVAPANMGGYANNEFPFTFLLSALPNAPAALTPIDIIVRQAGHEPLTLRLIGTVAPAGGGGFVPSVPGPVTPPPASVPGTSPGPATRLHAPATQAWSLTGVRLAPGQVMTLQVLGTVEASRDGRPFYHQVPPEGRTEHLANLPQPNLPALCLLGRFGNGPVFAVGRGGRFTGEGELLLGINDDDVADNTGFWSVLATVSKAAGATTPTLPNGNGGAAGDPIVCYWHWWDGRRVNVRSDGTVSAQLRFDGNQWVGDGGSGVWHVVDPAQRSYIINWNVNGVVVTDTLTLSADDCRLDGSSAQFPGVKIAATKETPER